MKRLNDGWLPSMLGAAGVVAILGAARSSNRRIVAGAFRGWASGRGSLFDLMADDAEIVIPGIAPHCGTFGKSEFIRDVATPFMARFSRPPIPKLRRIWSEGSDVAVLADASGKTLAGADYVNTYVFVLKMRSGRVVRATEFLDMAAFNRVWDGVVPRAAAAGEMLR